MTWGAIKRDSLDALFSDFIRASSKWSCERCRKYFGGRSKNLHCSHFYGRRNQAVRFDSRNADSLCSNCHRYFEENPSDYRDWKMSKLGEQEFYKLTLTAKNSIGKKSDRKMIEICLKQEIKKLKNEEL